jgi:xylan 1,4-beta-xylosidase
MSSAWAYFGYDEPNYTYMPNGKKLIGELAELSRAPVRIRAHHLLTTGDGTPGLKFGSTNAYTEDASGKPVYDWTIVDKIIGTYLDAGAKPLIELGFMPKALSSQPDPYTPNFRTPADFKNYYLGWAYPPRDYAKWGELVYQMVKHAIGKYGAAEVATWDWEVWNEPNISYWKGTPEEYDKLYDYSAAGLKRAFPEAHIGGPATTSPRDPKAAAFLRQFLQHCLSGVNEATGKTGAPLDFVSFHAKGSPDMVDGHVRMKLGNELRDASEGFDLVRSFDRLRNLPVILTEADPEGCAACSAKDNPANGYRNGPLYPTYEAAAISDIFRLADRDHINLKGIVTWAFEFEGKPYFAGYRDLATNGIDKPVLNVFRMLGLMSGERVAVNSSAAIDPEKIIRDNVRKMPLIDALAAKSSHDLSVLVWQYRDDDIAGPAAAVQLKLTGLPTAPDRMLLRHYRIDKTHSNAFTAWKQMGSPEQPDGAQYAKLEAAGALELLESPKWVTVKGGQITLPFTLPLQATSLLQLSW